jgi:formamidopyrimidine-DNA glycosylase
MPELPEVETYRRYFEATSMHQPIEAIEVEDRKLLTTDYATLTETLLGQSFSDTKRVGKNLFVLTNEGKTVHFHFGMTGDLEYYHSSLDRPRHARIVFHFRGGYNLGFICPRKFERIGLIENIDDYLKRKKIASDGLEITVEQLTQNLRKRKSFIKPVLLDQSTVAGIGNWIVDEVLFQAKIHPERLANSLADGEVGRIHTAIVYVLQTAIDNEVNYVFFPKSFLIHAREWADSPYDDPHRHLSCPCGKVKVAQMRVGGRATYFCPLCQVLS